MTKQTKKTKKRVNKNSVEYHEEVFDQVDQYLNRKFHGMNLLMITGFLEDQKVKYLNELENNRLA